MSDRRTIRFVEQWTVETKSDHRALFVHVQIRKRNSGIWTDLLLVSCNMGGHFDRVDLAHLFVVAKAAGWPTIFCFQEASDQGYLEDALRNGGYHYLAGKKAGAKATPMGVQKKRIDIIGGRLVKLLGKAHIGPGAGPETSKPKWWHRSKFRVGGVRFGASSWHATASQQNHLRMVAAIKEATAFIAVMARIRVPFFTVGDTNSDQDQPLSAWLRRHGLTSNHDQLGEIATHGTRSIDAVYVRKSLTAKPVKS